MLKTTSTTLRSNIRYWPGDRTTMLRKEVNEKSPLRILEGSTRGGLGPGKLGVVMARAGVGKTAFLVQIGLDDAMRERPVLHVALRQELDHVRSWYDALFDDLAEVTELQNREQVRALVNKNRVIQAYPDSVLPHERLDDILGLYADKIGFSPKAILIDGFDWESGKVVARAAELGAFKITAKRIGAELWMTAQTHRSAVAAHPQALIPPCDAYSDLIDLAIFLESEGTHATVRLLKDHDNARPVETHLHLDTDTMRIVSDELSSVTKKLPPSSFTLLSGGASGAEAAFGQAAERYGAHEVTFSFAGNETAHSRGLVELSDEELERGGVHETYIRAQLHRSFPKTPRFQRLLKSIWHQVATAGEVFVVGEIQPDGTVKGGTGWGAELARHFRKPLYVFDQAKNAWFRWKNDAWEETKAPVIQRTRFCGTGTRHLTESGRKAIDGLFERSFESR
jgi:KaiC/GvpD/RAD55 family RecA-like ATPase